MIYLITASLIWCFSFGLIGNTLADLPRAWVAALRLLIAAAIFCPFAKKIPIKTGALLFCTGAVQFGLMYLAYMYSYNTLKSHEVALFTIFTPLYISLINDLQVRKFTLSNLLIATLAVGGSAVILWTKQSLAASLIGFGLLQAAGICFAYGQLFYRKICDNQDSQLPPIADHHVFVWLYAGGLAVLMPAALLECANGGLPHPTLMQTATIIYLGAVAAGIAFFLWNKGARKVSAGILAVMNNLKIPAGVLVSLLIFGENANIPALLGGSILIGAAIWVAGRGQRIVRDKLLITNTSSQPHSD